MATSSNPAFNNNPAFKENPTAEQLQALYDLPSANRAPERVMTVEDTVVKSFITFGVILLGAIIGWIALATNPAIGATGVFVSAIAAFVFAMIALFRKQPSPTMVLLYAICQGFALGAISLVYESLYNGIILQAVIGTFAVVGVTLALFASGKIRASARATKIFFIAFAAYFLYAIVNMFLMMFGAIPASQNPWGLDGVEIFGIPLGIILAPVIILLGAYSLVLDFDMIQRGVANKAPAAFAWTGALSVSITVVWLYMQILRILAIARN
ncbi:MAG: hypothetical protein RLZZ600_1103 [Actinomycetota bacterium]